MYDFLHKFIINVLGFFTLLQSKLLFVLYEHASGYALFKVKEFDEIAALLPQVESNVTDISKFQSVVSLAAFQAFRSGTNSLENINAIAAGLYAFFLQ